MQSYTGTMIHTIRVYTHILHIAHDDNNMDLDTVESDTEEDSEEDSGAGATAAPDIGQQVKVVRRMSGPAFRSKLVTHFEIASRKGEVKWPKRMREQEMQQAL